MANTTRKKPTTEKLKTDIIVDDETQARVTETQTSNGNTIRKIEYTGKVANDTITENDENAESETIDYNDTFQGAANFDEIPKDKIDVFFDNIAESLTSEHDSFYIRVLRTPDNFDDTFYYPCRDLTSFGLFGCRLTERYKITELLQKKNNNSGGRFNLVALDTNQQPLLLYAGYAIEYGKRVAQTMPIVARDIFIPNPIREEITANNNSIESVLAKMLEIQNQNNQRILEAIQNAKPQQSQIETLLLTKAVDMITNPPQQNNGLEDKFMNLIMLPQVADRMAKRMFPEPPAPVTPAEPTTFDRALQVANLPQVQNLFEKIGDIAEAVAVAKIQQSNPALVTQVNNAQDETQAEQLPETTEADNKMKDLINELIAELESDSDISPENETIVKLNKDYPEQFDTVKQMCQVLTFPQLLELLISRTATMQPYPFEPFINRNTNPVSFNERGNKVVSRLEMVYTMLKS